MIRTIGVVIPAADEQERIGACLAAVGRARDRLRHVAPGVVVRTVVVLDCCTDATAAIAARYPGVETVSVTAGRVGAARAAGAAHLLAGSDLKPGESWLANTDADSEVPGHWLCGMLDRAAVGTDLVIGTVLPGPGLDRDVERAWLAAHIPREGHPHVHGANLGIRADTYLGLGGWPHHATGEDVALVDHAVATGGVRIARTAALPVRTSTRLTGRAPRGFSSYLRGIAPRP